MKYILISILVIGFSACNKRKTCYATSYDVGGQFAFKGFSAQELDTIVIRQYPADGQFAQIKAIDTLLTTVLLLNDTALKSDGYGFFRIHEGSDYEVILPIAARTFRITGITTDHQPITYDSNNDGFCDQKTDRILSPYKVVVDQVQISTTSYKGASTFVFLVK